jgi:hypothetical protein
MAFGERDTVRLCKQFREAMRRDRDGDGTELGDRLQHVEEAIRFLAAIQSIHGLSNDQVARLAEIAGNGAPAHAAP